MITKIDWQGHTFLTEETHALLAMSDVDVMKVDLDIHQEKL